jgi:hypothetical protein
MLTMHLVPGWARGECLIRRPRLLLVTQHVNQFLVLANTDR